MTLVHGPLRDDDEDQLVGRLLADGRYEVVRLIGSGGMAKVYLAEDRVLGRRVAIKIAASPEKAEDDEDRWRTPDCQACLEQEARLMAQVGTDPHVVQIHDVIRLGPDRSAIVMEYVKDGLTLADYLAAVGPLPFREAMKILRAVLLGLSAAHRNGIVHLDLKGGNVFMNEWDGLPKLGDFGIARPFVEPRQSELVMTTHQTQGTPGFAAPERLRGEPGDDRSDIYAAGVLLFQMLTGKMPFLGNTMEVGVQQLRESVPRPGVVRGEWVPRDLEAVIMKAMAKSPEDRFQSADEMISALDEAWLGRGERPTEGPPQPFHDARSLLRAAPAMALGAFLALLIQHCL